MSLGRFQNLSFSHPVRDVTRRQENNFGYFTILIFYFSALQTGVKVIIIISIFLVVLVIIYAIIYRLCKGKLGKMK